MNPSLMSFIMNLLTIFSSLDFWINRASFSLRSDVPTNACWSADGSLLAVSSSRQIALYNPDSSVQLMSLASPDARRIERVCFVGPSSRYVVASGKQSLVVWDLIMRRGVFVLIRDRFARF